MDSLPLRSCLECQGVNGTRAGYPSQESHGRTGRMSGVSPCAAAGAGGASVQAVASASGGGRRARSPAPRLSGGRPGHAWERAHSRAPGDHLGPASSPGVKGNRSRNWPSALSGSKLDPGLGEAGKRFPAGLQVTPARDGGPAGLLPCHELPTMATFRDGATAGLSPHRTVTHFSRAIPIPEMHQERNSGKGSSSLESLARSKATLGRNPIVCLLMNQSPQNLKECPPGTW